MTHIMFDIDGTLIQSYGFDEDCYLAAVKSITGLTVINNWETYEHITDRGILQTFIERQAQHLNVDELEALVKQEFVKNIQEHLDTHPAKEVKGAQKFFESLKNRDDVTISIATGGWKESALIKLQSAGFDISDVAMASSNDHHARIEIMKLANQKAQTNTSLPDVYFGDAMWDVKACAQLGVRLIIVGDRVEYESKIKDFTEDFSHLLDAKLGIV